MKKRYMILAIMVAAVLVIAVIALNVNFFAYTSTSDDLPFRTFAQISEFQVLETLGNVKAAPSDSALQGLVPDEVYEATFCAEGGADCVVRAYVFAQEADAQTYYKRISNGAAILDGIGVGSSSGSLGPTRYYALDHTRVLSITGKRYETFYTSANAVLTQLSVDLVEKISAVKNNTTPRQHGHGRGDRLPVRHAAPPDTQRGRVKRLYRLHYGLRLPRP